MTVSSSPIPSRVYIRLCKHGKRFLLLKYKILSLIPKQAVFSLNFSSAGKGPIMGWLGKSYVLEVHFPVGRGAYFTQIGHCYL